ncbi:MAG: hypothetical protein PHS34_08590 [Candidatus Omnitrophica bacterium]|nr:hypothetical protein [Candidatus Omnitrophota bacterium]
MTERIESHKFRAKLFKEFSDGFSYMQIATRYNLHLSTIFQIAEDDNWEFNLHKYVNFRYDAAKKNLPKKLQNLKNLSRSEYNKKLEETLFQTILISDDLYRCCEMYFDSHIVRSETGDIIESKLKVSELKQLGDLVNNLANVNNICYDLIDKIFGLIQKLEEKPIEKYSEEELKQIAKEKNSHNTKRCSTRIKKTQNNKTM